MTNGMGTARSAHAAPMNALCVVHHALAVSTGPCTW